MTIKIITPPAVEPVTLQEAKNHLRVDHDYDDALISDLIRTARETVEQQTRPLITQTHVLLTDCLLGEIELKPNLQSVTAIRYIDADGIQQTLPASDYETSTRDAIGIVYPAYGKTWPAVRAGKNAVEIEFVCGYGNPDDVPAPIRSAMLLLVGHLYQNRESVIIGTIASETPMSFALLLNPYRVSTV